VDDRADLLSQRAASKTELPHKTEKQTANCNPAWTTEGIGGMLNLPQRKGVGQGTKLSVNKHIKAVKADSRQVASHHTKQGRKWITELIS
jgi:hypothetical protein